MPTVGGLGRRAWRARAAKCELGGRVSVRFPFEFSPVSSLKFGRSR
jgi:hypothetical protein